MRQLVTAQRREHAAFDNAALVYDDEFERHPATRRLRRIVWNLFFKHFHQGDYLLELNCGTGTDAIELASNGIRVLATDASAEMIAVAQGKLDRTALHSLVTPMQLSFQRLRTLSGQQFDGAYSNFGGLNCTSRLHQVAFDLATLVKPGKYIALCLMPNFCLWETFTFLLRGKWKKAFRRRQPNGVLADVHGEKVWVHYYSPQLVRHIFAPHFDFVSIQGLNVFSPPPSMRTSYTLLWKANQLLEMLDDALPKNSVFHGWGDHYLIVLRRKGAR